MSPSTRLSPMDAAWLHMEHPNHPMTITALLWFSEPLGMAALREVVQERLADRVPRFCERVAPSLVPLWPPHWEPERDFDLGAHLHLIEPDDSLDREGLAAQVGRLMSEPLGLDRSPWSMHLVDYQQGSALIVRVHHCMADGISLARVLLSLTDSGVDAPAHHPPHPRWMSGLAPLTSRPMPHAPPAPPDPVSEPSRVAEMLRLGADAARELEHLVFMAPDPWTPLRGPLTTSKACAWSRPMCLDRVKAIGRQTGCTVNDVLVSAWAGALRAHLLDRGAEPAEIRAFVPVNLRAVDGTSEPELGNRFSMVVLPLPIDEAAPLGRLERVHAEMQRLKASTEPAVAWALLNLMGATPPLIERMIADVFGTRATTLLTNVPGPREPITLAGSPLVGVQVWIPHIGGLGASLSIFSYAGSVTVGVSADTSLVPEPQRLVDRFEAAFMDLCTVVETHQPA